MGSPPKPPPGSRVVALPLTGHLATVLLSWTTLVHVEELNTSKSQTPQHFGCGSWRNHQGRPLIFLTEELRYEAKGTKRQGHTESVLRHHSPSFCTAHPPQPRRWYSSILKPSLNFKGATQVGGGSNRSQPLLQPLSLEGQWC